MRRLIRVFVTFSWNDLFGLIARFFRAVRYMRRLHYSAHLAWIKAAR